MQTKKISAGKLDLTQPYYQPRGCITDVMYDKSPALCISGPAGTGKSRGALEKCHILLQKYPGCKGLMVRKTRQSMTQTCIDTFNRFVIQDKSVCKWKAQDQEYLYSNKSKFVVSGLDDPTKILSGEYDFIYVQQGEEVPLSAYEDITTRLRNGKIPYQQIILDVNPADPNHWIQKLVKAGILKYYQSWHKDNPILWDEQKQEWTARGTAYMAILQNLSGVKYDRLYKGLWVSAEGAVYPLFNNEIHIIPQRLFKPSKEATHIWCVDFGFNDPFVWQDWVLTDEGNMILVHEYYHTEKLVDEAAHEIAELPFNRDDNGNLKAPYAIICDTDAEGRGQLEKAWGMMTLPAYKKIREGIQAVNRRIAPGRGVKPKIYFMEDCLVHEPDPNLVYKKQAINIFEEFVSYSYPQGEKAKPGKLDIPIDKDNHSMDTMRYAVAFVDDLAIDPHTIDEHLQLDEDLMVKVSPY